MKKWEDNEIEKRLEQAMDQEEIPEGLKPERIEQMLKNKENQGAGTQKNYRKWYGSLAAAACLVLLLFAADNMKLPQTEQNTDGKPAGDTEATEDQAPPEEIKPAEQESASELSYEELYAYFQDRKAANQYEVSWQESLKGSGDMVSQESLKGNGDMVSQESTAGGQEDSAAQEKSSDFGHTNRQEENVDEADILKNDGRYLYQVIYDKNDNNAVQIVDTKEGLKEVARITGLQNIDAMYIWEDLLVVLEQGYAAETIEEDTSTKENGRIVHDMAPVGKAYVKINIYHIKDRSKPEEVHSFTVQGSWLDSRISEGYLYCFMERGTEIPANPKDYDAYVPVLEGKQMEASSIYLPEDAQAQRYVVMASVDLKHPKEFKDTKALVSGGDRVYVTEENIYIMDSRQPEIKEAGRYSSRTGIFRFSYKDGMITKEAEGSVKGILLDDMAVSESKGYLRVATTVESYQVKEIWDDILDRVFGFDTSDHKTTNSLYVLDKKLKVTGKIEELAEDEQIYSARFMGDTGYFVTFRETDPLFSVDLSDPADPKILGELKISGFSEYLHFYKEDLLLGIGMEADEDTGRTQGMKLSMFDISDPANVKEQHKYDLSGYDFSEALYNYKAVMIDTEKNLFGFFAEGYRGEESKRDYLVFTYDYENERFQEKMKISCGNDEKHFYSNARGTYIGEVFYLLCGNGRIESYSLTDGEQREILEAK